MEVAIGIDVGGSNLRVALVDAEGHILQHRIQPVEAHNPGLLLEQAQAMVGLCLPDGDQIPPIGLALPAPVHPFDGSHGLVFNVPALNQMDFAAELRKSFGTRVQVDNDANAAALGLVRLGSYRGLRDLIYVTVSTSIGAGIIAGGRLIHGLQGGAGEFGHTSLNLCDALCYECKSNHGCLTSLASGRGLVWRANELGRRGEVADDSPLANSKLSAEQICTAAEAGNAQAIAIIQMAGLALGTATATLVNLLNPQRIAFGGSVIQNQDAIWERLCQVARERCMPQLRDSVCLERVSEGDTVGVVGAAALVWEAD